MTYDLENKCQGQINILFQSWQIILSIDIDIEENFVKIFLTQFLIIGGPQFLSHPLLTWRRYIPTLCTTILPNFVKINLTDP